MMCFTMHALYIIEHLSGKYVTDLSLLLALGSAPLGCCCSQGIVRSRLNRRIWLSGASRTAQIGRGGPTTLYRGTTREVDVEKVTIQIPEEAISCARALVDELRETGAAVDTANWGQMAKVDENACERDERGNLWIVGDQFRDGMLSVQREAVSQNLVHAGLTITNGVYGVLAGCAVQQGVSVHFFEHGRRKG
jgi:hypothetical protein